MSGPCNGDDEMDRARPRGRRGGRGGRQRHIQAIYGHVPERLLPPLLTAKSYHYRATGKGALYLHRNTQAVAGVERSDREGRAARPGAATAGRGEAQSARPRAAPAASTCAGCAHSPTRHKVQVSQLVRKLREPIGLVT